MASKAGQQIITIHISPNISRRKDNQAIKYSIRNIFLQKPCKKWGRRLILGLFLFSKNALYKVKSSGQHPLVSIYFCRPRLQVRLKVNICMYILICILYKNYILYIYLSIYLYISISISIYLSIYLSIYTYIYTFNFDFL